MARAARAEQPEPMRRIGVLLALDESNPEVKSLADSFPGGLQQTGGGRMVAMFGIDHRSATGDHARLKTYAGELLRMAPDVLFKLTHRQCVLGS
jgi:putative ABC transport system substrate-binding protein